jgi:hypothetical protein
MVPPSFPVFLRAFYSSTGDCAWASNRVIDRFLAAWRNQSKTWHWQDDCAKLQYMSQPHAGGGARMAIRNTIRLEKDEEE